MANNFKIGVPAFCQWARKKYGSSQANVYIRMDLLEDEAQLRERMVHGHFAVWVEFMAQYAAVIMGVRDGK